MQVLANLTSIPQATTSLVLKSSLLSWIEMQLLEAVREAETTQWLKIFENIIVVVDPGKLENASVGGWRRTLVRCMQLVMDRWKTRCKLLSSSFSFPFSHEIPVYSDRLENTSLGFEGDFETCSSSGSTTT
jgi:hypothetical protein